MWRAYGYELSVGYIWRWSDWVERSIFIVLALMLCYNVFIVSRFFHRYYLARRESLAHAPDSGRASQLSRTRAVVDLSRGLPTVKSIASAAPFLGLAGACYGILALLFRTYMGPRGSVIATIVSGVVWALVPTVAGLLVATPAAMSYNLLRSLLEKFEPSPSISHFEATSRSYGFAQTLPLRGRFSGMPAFALLGAPVLALLIPMFALMLRSQGPVGLRVHLLQIGVSDHGSEPIVISVIARNTGGRPILYVNSKEMPWNELGNAIQSHLKVRPHWIVYVEGESDASWRGVVRAIDVAQGQGAEVVLLTAIPQASSGEHTRRRGPAIGDRKVGIEVDGKK